jgi:diaminopropionate ammonia-lyase
MILKRNNRAVEQVDSPFESDPRILEFHKRLDGYATTDLVDLPNVAEEIGIGRLLVKHEAERYGLPAFKMLGASWAIYRAVCDLAGEEPEWDTFDELAAAWQPLLPLRLAAATDGNHGRAVASMARRMGFSTSIWVPAGTAAARIASIESEGATVTVVDGTYDDAVAISALEADEHTLVISDTSWEGYRDVPTWVIDGYSTIMTEIGEQLAELGVTPDAVFAQLGVGALGAAVVTYFKRDPGGPSIVGVEPSDANCVMAAVEANEIVTVPGPHVSHMVGLNCGTVSPLAFPVLRDGLDWMVGIDDEDAYAAMRTYAANGLVSGETGSSGLGALLALARGGKLEEMGLGPDSTVVVINTESATDPENYLRVVGKTPEEVAAS